MSVTNIALRVNTLTKFAVQMRHRVILPRRCLFVLKSACHVAPAFSSRPPGPFDLPPIQGNQIAPLPTEDQTQLMHGHSGSPLVFLTVALGPDLLQSGIALDFRGLGQLDLHDEDAVLQDHGQVGLALVGDVLGDDPGVERGEKGVEHRGVPALAVQQVSLGEITIGNGGEKAVDEPCRDWRSKAISA